MSQFKTWIRTMLDRWKGKDELPKAPSYRRQALDFVECYPQATVWEWVEVYNKGCQTAWEAGYQVGYLTKVVGSVELPAPIEDSQIRHNQGIDLDRVVELQDPKQVTNVVFTTDEGLGYRHE